MAFFKKENNIFFNDEQWLGKKVESILLCYFLIYHNYKKSILYIVQEDNWYLWEKTY